MIVEVINKNFSNISKVYYRVATGRPARYLYKAGTHGLDNLDFLESDFKYIQDKKRFKSPEVLSFLDSPDKETINASGLGGIEKYLSTLFPTVISGDPRNDRIEYFNTYIDSTGKELFCFLVPESISEIWMYEEMIDEDWVIRIQFGLKEDEDGEIVEVPEEIYFSKAIWLITSYSKEGTEILNLSWTAYQVDKDPIRKMSEYVLRNDSFVSNFEGYHEKDGYIYSNISGSLVGTEEISRPIYDSIIESKGWNRSKRYSRGDKAWLGSTEYESVESDNIGNHPYYSRMWIKAGLI